jgi:UDP-glucose:(heptosyl)LPS alpha-1,3-glucosyltransferase
MMLSLWVRRLGRTGGTERFVHGFAQWLLRQDLPFELWCTGIDEELPGLEPNVLPLRGRGRVWKMWAADRAFSGLPPSEGQISFLRAGNAQIHRAGGGCHLRWMQVGGGGIASRYELAIEKRVLSNARLIIANSQLAATGLEDLYGISQDRVALIRNGVDLLRFRPGGGESVPSGTICFMGGGFHRKGLDRLIMALALLPRVRLEVIGHDPQWRRFLRLAQKAGVLERVVFRGDISAPEKILPRCDVFVLPTRYDSAANSCLEALACGVPVVTTASNGMSEILPMPWMCIDDPDDPVALSKAIARAMSTPGLRDRSREVAEEFPAEKAYRALWERTGDMG